MEDTVDWSTLIGKSFHQLDDDGYADRQGIIVSEPYPKVFVVQQFEWVTGSPGWGERLVTLETILCGRWVFYATVDEMKEAYEYGGFQRPG